MSKTGIPYLDFTWNPCGFGCSAGCPTCWARRLAPRIGKNVRCAKCAAFEVHLHPERLDQPGRRKKPATIGVQFTGELFDPHRPGEEIDAVLAAARAAPQHTYVFLTQRPQIMIRHCGDWRRRIEDKWFHGFTVRHEMQMAGMYQALHRIRGKKWISAEPLVSPLDLTAGYTLDDLAGMVVGCDNNPKAPQPSTSWIRSIVDECRTADVPVYVKQIRNGVTGRLLTNVEEFPVDLRVRELPWPLTTKTP